MQITCKVNQAEAIRRGFDCPSTVKLEINPADLTQDERETLALLFAKGELNDRLLHSSLELNEPTVAALREMLATYVARKQQIDEDLRRHEAEVMAEAMEIITSKKTQQSTRSTYAWKNTKGVIALTDNSLGDPGYKASYSYPFLQPYSPGRSSNALTQALKSPEGIAWLAELDATNASALAAAEARVLEDCRLTCEKSDAKAARRAALAAYWDTTIREHGTALQIERLNRGLIDAQQEARAILVQQLIQNPDGLPLAHSDPANREYEDKTPLTDEDMALILRYEAATPGSSAELITCTYSPAHDPYEEDTPEVETTTELWLTLPHNHGIDLRQHFVVA